MKECLLLLLGLITFFSNYPAQSQNGIEIISNPDFEDFQSLPDDHNQITRCDFWLPNNYNTPDYYHNSSTFQGPCQINVNYFSNQMSSWADELQNWSGPRIAPHSGLAYSGIGRSEGIRNQLTVPVFPSTMVKFSCYFAFRDDIIPNTSDIKYGISLINDQGSEAQSVNLGEINVFDYGVHSAANMPISSCNWYHYETDWIKIDEGQSSYFPEILISGRDNPAGDFPQEGYIYIDDVSLMYYPTCCPYDYAFQNTSDLPSVFKVMNTIHVGEAVIPGSPIGPVIVPDGSSTELYCKDYYTDGGLLVELGGQYQVIPEPCEPGNNTNPGSVGDPEIILIENYLNRSTNDKFQLIANHTESIEISIKNRWGCTIHEATFTNINENIITLWDGSCTLQCGLGGGGVDYCSDGTYYYFITLHSCDGTLEENGFLQVFGSSSRMGNYSESEKTEKDSIPNQKILFYPNPANESIQLIIASTKESINQITIYNNPGQVLYETSTTANSLSVPVASFAEGHYFIQVRNESGQWVKPFVVKR